MPNTVDSALLALSNYPNQQTLETQFGDMDVAQHINNVAIMKYYESVRCRYLMAIFGGKDIFFAAAYTFVNVEATVKYLAEIHYPEPVIIGSAIASIGNSSCHAQQAIFQAGQCVGLCRTSMVMVSKGKSAPIPDGLRAQLQAERELFK